MSGNDFYCDTPINRAPFCDCPPANTGHPGEDVNCRCVALPVLS